jgi:hypothetical protein
MSFAPVSLAALTNVMTLLDDDWSKKLKHKA